MFCKDAAFSGLVPTTLLSNQNRVRKISAILLFLVFILSQYIRHLAYLECRIENAFNSATRQCDCEKLNTFEAGNHEFPSAPVPHTHFHPDDFFEKPPQYTASAVIIIFYTQGDFSRQSQLNGFHTGPWQPPEC